MDSWLVHDDRRQTVLVFLYHWAHHHRWRPQPRIHCIKGVIKNRFVCFHDSLFVFTFVWVMLKQVEFRNDDRDSVLWMCREIRLLREGYFWQTLFIFSEKQSKTKGVKIHVLLLFTFTLVLQESYIFQCMKWSWVILLLFFFFFLKETFACIFILNIHTSRKKKKSFFQVSWKLICIIPQTNGFEGWDARVWISERIYQFF